MHPRWITDLPSAAASGFPWRLGALLWVVLVGLDALARLTYWGRHHRGGDWLDWFEATSEGTVPTLVTLTVTATVGLVCMFRRVEGRGVGCWRALGVLFVYLAVDDLVGLHERFGAWLHPWLGGHGVYAWVMVLGPLFAIWAALCARCVLRCLPGRRECWALLGGFGALACALACEALEARITASPRQLRGLPLAAYAHWLEESLELLGPLLLLGAVWPGRALVAAGRGDVPSTATVRYVGAGR